MIFSNDTNRTNSFIINSGRYQKSKERLSPKFNEPLLKSKKRENPLNISSNDLYVPKQYFRVNRGYSSDQNNDDKHSTGSNSPVERPEPPVKVSFAERLANLKTVVK